MFHFTWTLWRHCYHSLLPTLHCLDSTAFLDPTWFTFHTETILSKSTVFIQYLLISLLYLQCLSTISSSFFCLLLSIQFLDMYVCLLWFIHLFTSSDMARLSNYIKCNNVWKMISGLTSSSRHLKLKYFAIYWAQTHLQTIVSVQSP